MKLCIIITLLLGWATFTFGQDKELDSLGFPLKSTNAISQLHDKVDSIRSCFYSKSDSLKRRYKSRFTKLDSSQSVLQSTLHKLRSIQLSPRKIGPNGIADSVSTRFKTSMDSASARLQANKITHKIDSIKELRQKALSNLNEDLQSIKSKTTEKLNKLDLPPQLKDNVSNVQQKISDFKIPTSDVTIPSLQTGQNSMSTLNSLSLESPALNLESSVGDIGKVGSLPDVQGDIGGIPDLTGKASGYGNDIQQIANGNLSEVKELPKTAEEKAAELSGLEGIKEQTQVLDEYKDQAGEMQSPDSVKEFAVQEVRQYAVNHFAGREEQLKQAMETVAKYKTKYSSLNSVSEITKRPPNEMRGKPLIERIVPGIAFQLQKRGEDLLVDFNVYAGYRFTGRLMGGAGWNQRIAYNTKKNYFNPKARIFGPRVFGEFKLWKGFSPRVEVEIMNTIVPTLTRTPSLDPGKRQWVPGAFVGMRKEYRFIKSIKGTALVMVRLYNPDHKSPYADVLNVRFGFEFPMKKNRREKKINEIFCQVRFLRY